MLVYIQVIENDNDKIKFEKLYYHYRGLMFHVAYNVLQNEMDAEDAVHDAFLAIARNMSKIKFEIKSPQTQAFVVIIVKRKAINIYNENKRANTAELDDMFMPPVPPKEIHNDVYSAMCRLPEKWQEILYLRYYCGYSPKEIAQMLEISYDAVQKSLQRGKAALRKELEKEDINL